MPTDTSSGSRRRHPAARPPGRPRCEDTRPARPPATIGSIGLDLLYDVPGQTDASWAATLERALELGVDHLSLYALTLDDPDAEGLTGPLGDHLPVRSGARRWRVAARAAQDEDRAARAYEMATERLARAGLRGYEISNWARPGHESRHNLAYWRRLPHEAAGPGAHGFDGLTRWWNAAPLEAYLDALVPPSGAPPRLPPGGTAANPADAAAEAAILGLRLDAGLDPATAAAPPLGDHLAWAEAAGLLERGVDARVRLTVRGRLLSNELFARLL